MIYVIFESIHFVMKAEKALKKENIDFELRPNPAELISSCGLCISFQENLLQKILSILSSCMEQNIFSCYKRENGNFVKLEFWYFEGAVNE